MTNNFTVLQSVYKNDNPQFLKEAFLSLENSTLLPKKIILVKDGCLSNDLENVISEWQKKLPLQVVGYELNNGLGYALNYGLQFCETELVCRMDSDDICLPDRFEKQIKYMEEHPDIAICSGYISEFFYAPEKIEFIRAVPCEHDMIVRGLKRRNTFNHMTVCFRKTAVLKAGNYQNVPYFEDYDLWIRMILSGARTANLADILVNARIGNDMIGRRYGLKYARYELKFFNRQLKNGFLSWFDFAVVVILRIPCRLLPKCLVKMIYKLLRWK